MIRRTIEISSGAARLSVERRQLVIERPETERATVPIEDIGLLIVDHPQVTYSHAVFAELIEAGAAVVVCGRDHLPSGLMLPLAANTIQSERFRVQIEAALPVKKQCWRSVIAAKIALQGEVLAWATGEDCGLGAMAGRVRSGDPDNLEAQAAQRYWPRLMGPEFRRDRAGPMPNPLLNYGYAILRASMARSLAASGLIATLGIHHHNRYNAFCLADDMLEPYRPYVDWRVKRLVDSGEMGTELTRDSKRALLALLNQTIVIDGRRSPLSLAQQSTSASLAESFEAGEARLRLPAGLPIFPEPSDGAVEDMAESGEAADAGGSAA